MFEKSDRKRNTFHAQHTKTIKKAAPPKGCAAFKTEVLSYQVYLDFRRMMVQE